MSEALDKAERARFLAVQRLRRTDQYAADLLDLALLMENWLNGIVSLNCAVTPDGARLDIEIGELEAGLLESAEEEEVADHLSRMIEDALADGRLARPHSDTTL